MLKGIDHLVILVPDLASSIEPYRSLGFNVVDGGRHATGTHNALIPFEDGTYLELIAFHTENSAHRWWQWHKMGGGFIDYCFVTDDLDGDRLALVTSGTRMSPPYEQTRSKPDGVMLRWEVSIPEPPRVSAAPILIRDKTPRAARVPQGVAHENGAIGIGAVTVAVSDASLVRDWATKLPGTEAIAFEESGNSGRTAVRVLSGSHSFDFLVPQESNRSIKERLSAFSYLPISIELVCRDRKQLRLNWNWVQKPQMEPSWNISS